MATNPNMEAIQTVTVSATSAANIEFTNIPQDYTDLLLKISARHTTNETSNDILITINGSTSNFTAKRLYGNGSSASSDTNSQRVGLTVGASATASTFGSTDAYFPNYAGSANKSFSSDMVGENNATLAYSILTAGLWSDTSAITSIRIAPASGSFVQHSTATLYGVTSAAVGSKATGGIVTSDANYYYHTFLNSGTFTPTQSLTADYLVVAGGGGGSVGGGGGAGGMRSTVTATGGGGSLESALSLTAQAYTVTVGAGGAGGNNSNKGTNGSDSVFSTITSTGGGGGGTNGGGKTAGANGGSGGGAGADTSVFSGGTGTANQGYAGGSNNTTGPTYYGGGGGGAGAVGGNGSSGAAGAGGAGVATSISGSSVTYAVGGDSVAYNTGPLTGAAGTTNRGNGAGACKDNGTGGAGGSGIVIVRYAK